MSQEVSPGVFLLLGMEFLESVLFLISRELSPRNVAAVAAAVVVDNRSDGRGNYFPPSQSAVAANKQPASSLRDG